MVAPAKLRLPITQGFDYNFHQLFTITSTTLGDADGYANVYIPLKGPVMSFYLINTSANLVEYSFNGNKTHGFLAGNSERLYQFRRVSKIWFRAPVGTVTVSLEAWMHP